MMETTERITRKLEESIEKSHDKASIINPYVPESEYTTSTRVIKTSLNASLDSKLSPYLPTEIQGQSGTYEILSKITLETAKSLQTQTGLVVTIEPGKESTEFIGNRGYFGQLRLGREKKTGRYYGIKEITEASKVKESLEEARIQRKLNGLPYLMPLIDIVELRDAQGNLQLYHVMPLAALGNGKELAHYLADIKDKSFKEALLVHVAKCILKGFQGLHQKEIAHLDFKPDNLVVDKEGNILIIDFGCAKLLDNKGYVIGRNLGYVNYYSPERNVLSANFSGKANDCYTLGLTLLELAIGIIPNKKDKSPEDYLVHPYCQNALPGSYAALVKDLLEIEPTKRLTIETALEWPLFLQPTSSQILSYLREFVQSLQWANRVKETKGLQQNLTSAQQLPLPHFAGYSRRAGLENKIIERLLSGKLLTVCVGIGGVGKTQLLTYIVHNTPEVQARFKPIYWFKSADSETSLDIQYYGLAKELKLINDKTPLEEAKRLLIKRFEQQEDLLIVLDNADNPKLLESFLPERGNILLSSRSPEWQETISIGVMELSEVQELLVKLMPERKISSEEAKELGEVLGYLPLALSQAIAMIRQENLQIKDYVENYQQKQKELLSIDTKLFGKHLPHSMVTLYQLQLQRLETECPEAIQLLNCSALLAPDAIPVELLMEESLGKETSLETYQKAQQQLIEYALWQIREDGIYIHRLMQEVVRLPLTEEVLTPLFLKIAKRVNTHYDKEASVLEKEKRQKTLLTHLQALKKLGEKVECLKRERSFVTILTNIGYYYEYLINQPKIAQPLFEAALASIEKHYSPDPVQTAKALDNLGNAYYALGDYGKAKEFLLRALTIKESRYDSNNPEIGATLTNLANAYGSLGDYEEQKKLLLRALTIHEKYYGQDHVRTGITLTNLGNAYIALGYHKEAEEFLLRALTIDKKHYGPDHVQTAKTLDSLGNAYYALGDYEGAKGFLLRALTIKENHYDSDNPEIGATLTNLANAYGSLGDYEEQKKLLLRALSIDEKYYGQDHPSTGITLTNLGNAYGSLGDYEEQKKLLLRALAIHEKHYGQDHVQTGNVLTYLGEAYFEVKDIKTAYTYQKRAYDIFFKFYGRDNQWTKYAFEQLQKLEAFSKLHKPPLLFLNSPKKSNIPSNSTNFKPQLAKELQYSKEKYQSTLLWGYNIKYMVGAAVLAIGAGLYLFKKYKKS